MQNYLDPRNDIVFKIYFTTPDNQFLLISFLEAVIRPTIPISKVKIMNPDLPKDILDEKGSVLDILVTLEDGTQIDVEMQMASSIFFKKRVLFYWAKLYSKQLKRGHKYQKLAPTISIAILAENEFKDHPYEAHSIFELRERKRNELYLPDAQLHFLELPKLKAWTENKNFHYNRENGEKLANWMHFFDIQNDTEGWSIKMENDPIMSKALKALKIISENQETRELAEMRERARLNYSSSVAGAYSQGKVEGKAEGEIETITRNIKQMTKKGLSPEKISDLLEIDLSEVLKIMNS
jgi:predicted transposase/invertase (TIGR01784 family)